MPNDQNGLSANSLYAGALSRFGDVQVNLSVELGKTELPLKDVLGLQEGSVVSLNRLTDELLDVTANGKAIARAEVVAQDGRFALRVVELVGDNDASEAAAWPPASAPTDAAMNVAASAPKMTEAENGTAEPIQGVPEL